MQDTIFALRTSDRQFKADAVPQEALAALLTAAAQAPSAGNLQPWHFYVVQNAALRNQLCTAAYKQGFIADAPVSIVVCAEPERSAVRYGERGETLYCLQDTAAAIQNILLCAAQLGLGTCWCGAFDESAVTRALSLPGSRRPVAILAIGYPKRQHKKTGRREMGEVVTYLD